MIVLAMLAAGSTGKPGIKPTYHVMGAAFGATDSTGAPRATMHASVAGTVTLIHWEITQAGVPGGGPTFTLSVEADGISVCAATLPCDTTGSGHAVCDGAFVEDQDIHLEISASGCVTPPLLVASATWRQ